MNIFGNASLKDIAMFYVKMEFDEMVPHEVNNPATRSCLNCELIAIRFVFLCVKWKGQHF